MEWQKFNENHNLRMRKLDLGEHWVDQSRSYDPNSVSLLYYAFLYAIIAFSTCILIHSGIQYKWEFSAVRKCVDIAALTSAIQSIFLLISFNNPNITKSAILRNLVSYGILQCIVLLCDNYMFYKSYSAVIKVQPWKRNLIHCYVWIILILTWLPKWIIVPFFSTPGNEDYIDAYFVMDQMSYYGNIAYNFYFTVQFTRVLLIMTRNTRDLRTGLKQKNNRTIILIGKGIGHCVTSTLAALLRTLDTGEKGMFIYIMHVFVGSVTKYVYIFIGIDIFVYVYYPFKNPRYWRKRYYSLYKCMYIYVCM
jgi:hypothetical protein